MSVNISSPSRSAFSFILHSVKPEKMSGPTKVQRSPLSPLAPVDPSALPCISQSPPPLSRWLGLTSPRLAPRSFDHLLSPPLSPDAPAPRSPVFGGKKRVVFADARGLVLVTVHYICLEEEEGEGAGEEGEEEEKASRPAAPVETPPGAAWLPGAAGARAPEFRAPLRKGRHLRLGFPQPAGDRAAFRARLQEELVLLESCRVSGESLSGTVRARSPGVDKAAAYVRVTFDSWRSHRDVPCSRRPPPPPPGSPDGDLFAFDIPLPEKLDPRERVEFCVSLLHGKGAVLWDRNKGQNYRVLVGADSDTPAASLLASRCSSLTLTPGRRAATAVAVAEVAGRTARLAPSCSALHVAPGANANRRSLPIVR